MNDKPNTWIEHQAAHFEKRFNEHAEDFIHQFRECGGLKCIHILTTIRELEAACLLSGAYNHVVRNSK